MLLIACTVGVLGQLALNMDTSTAAYRQARAQGGGVALVIGDSLVYREGAIWENLVEISSQLYGSGGLGYQGISLWTGASYNASQWTQGAINQDTPPHWSLDGLWVSTSSPTTPSWINCTPWSRTTTLHYVTGPDQGAFTVTSGASSWQVQAGGTQGVGALALQLPFPSLSITTAGNGNVTLLGFVNGAPSQGPVLHRVANGGWGLDETLNRNWTWDAQVSLLSPQLVLVCYGGQNDWAYSFNTAIWDQYLRQVCDRVHAAAPSAGIVLVSNYASSADPSVVARWVTLSGVQRALATERAYGFVDLFRAGGVYEAWVASGFVAPDGLHFSDAGGHHAAHIIHCAIDSNGACLASAPCNSTDFNGDALSPDTADIDDFLSVFSGGPCPTGTCAGIDFNRDGLAPDTLDIDALLSVFSGGPCL
ncbi:MAG: GDSL-type esterase/lipase family protein [Phycisphaerales bacterium]